MPRLFRYVAPDENADGSGRDADARNVDNSPSRRDALRSAACARVSACFNCDCKRFNCVCKLPFSVRSRSFSSRNADNSARACANGPPGTGWRGAPNDKPANKTTLEKNNKKTLRRNMIHLKKKQYEKKTRTRRKYNGHNGERHILYQKTDDSSRKNDAQGTEPTATAPTLQPGVFPA